MESQSGFDLYIAMGDHAAAIIMAARKHDVIELYAALTIYFQVSLNALSTMLYRCFQFMSYYYCFHALCIKE